VSQNVSAGADLAEAAGVALDNVSSALDQVDPDSLRVVDGAIDVEAIRAVEQPLADVQASLVALRDTTEDVRSPWLLGRIQTELDELTTEFDDNEPRLQNAIDAVRLAPQILGAEGPRRYLVLFTTPVEARGIAGFPGNYAVIEIDDGDINVADFGRRSDLDRAAAENEASCLECPPEMRERYGPWGVDAGGGRFGVPGWTGITTAAHFPYVGETAQIIYPQSGGEPIDGVISMDPYVLQALMRYTGPIELSETGVVVEPENAARFLLEDQYLLLEDGANEDRIEALDTLGRQVIEELLAGALPVPSDLARNLGPLVAEQRLLMWTTNPEEQELIDRVGMSGALPPLGDDGGFAVMVSNGGNSKIDAFLDRTVDTTIETRDDGTRVLVADVTLTNTAPATGLPQYVIGNSFGFPEGTSWLWVNFFGPDGLLSATADGEPMELETGTEVGWTTYERYEALAPGETVSYRLEFEVGPDLDGIENVVRWTQPLARRSP
jgi:hypothetical protein